MGVQGTNYFGNHLGAPQVLQGTPNYNVEVSEGLNPPGEFYPAFYLPTVVSENRLQGSAYVLMPGKVVAFDKDTRNRNGRLIPAGLAWDYKTFTAAEAVTPGTGSTALRYTTRDEEFGIVGADYTPVTASVDGQDGPAADMAASSDIIGVTDPIGIMRYSSLTAPGTNPGDPSTFFKHSYDTGGARAFSRWGYIQLPVLEVEARKEEITEKKTSYRVALYKDSTPFAFLDNLNAALVLTLKANASLLTEITPGTGPTEYAIMGRTLLFNSPIPAGETFKVVYTPKVDTPFTCLKLKSNDAATGTIINNSFGTMDMIGQSVGYDINSNFGLFSNADGSANTDIDTAYKLGSVLDVKNGSDKDLAMVMTWYRDQGMWQETPGSATEGRNTQLSIVNAPKFVARIAYNFNQNF